MAWKNAGTIKSQSFTCGFCGNLIASSLGYDNSGAKSWLIYVCSHCKKPTFFEGDKQLPGVAPGDSVAHLPVDVESLYTEARNCIAASCHTAAVLVCRKLLMNIAVSQEAAEGETFVKYVEYLAAKGYVPPNGHGWVDHIRKKGNEANHEIVLMSKTDADDLVLFIEMLLRFMYEFPNKIPAIP